MVLAMVPGAYAAFDAAGCSSCQETAERPLPSPFMRTAPAPFARGPTHSRPEKLASEAKVVAPSPKGSVDIATASAMMDGFEEVDAVCDAPSLASVALACASSCSDPSAEAVKVQLKVALEPPSSVRVAGAVEERRVTAPAPAAAETDGAAGIARLAVASPEFVTVIEVVNGSPSGS